MRTFKMGETVKFKNPGYDIADVRNPSPPETWEGKVNGDAITNHMVAGGGYIPLWCQRENREPTTVYVCFENIL